MAEADMAKADKLGLKTNLKVKHPFTGIDLDVWIANYVLMDYGTGVVMGVQLMTKEIMSLLSNII